MRHVAHVPQLRPLRCFPGTVPLHEVPLSACVGPGRPFRRVTQLAPPPRKPPPPLLPPVPQVGCPASPGSFCLPGSQGAASPARLGVCPQAGTVAAVWDAPGKPSALRFPVGLSDESPLRPLSSPCASSCVPYPPLLGGCLSYSGALHTPPRDSALPSEMV